MKGIIVTRVDYLHDTYYNLGLILPGLYVTSNSTRTIGYVLVCDGDIPEVYYCELPSRTHVGDMLFSRNGRVYKFVTADDQITYMRNVDSGFGFKVDVDLPSYSWGHTVSLSSNRIVVKFVYAVVYITIID